MFPFLGEALAEGAETITEAATVTEAAAVSAKQAPTWSEELVEKFAETPGRVWIAVAALAALAAILFAVSRSSKRWNAKMLAMGALSIALSFVLSCIRLFRMPTHGSVTPGSMLPLMLFSACYGMGPGLLAGLAYGVLQYFQDPQWLNVWQFVFDYLIAFSALGLAGIAWKKKEKWLYIGIPVAVLGRAVSAILAGIMWAYEYLDYGLKIGSMEFSSPILYSIVYNGVYLIPETVICLLLALLIAKPVMKIMKSR